MQSCRNLLGVRMDKNIVSLRQCKDYEINNVKNTIEKCFSDLGGIQKYIKPNMTVVIKANLVEKYSPEKAVTTHPSVIEAIATKIKNIGAKCIIADSPAAFYNEKHLNKIYEITGMNHASNQSEAQLNKNFESVNIKVDGEKTKNIDIIDVVDKTDVIINVAKFKTHSLTGYTGAIKNLFGIIPGLVKAQMHSLYPELRDFCNFLIDVERSISKKLVLNFIDAVVGMEGAGPTSGTPRIVNRIIASQSAYAADAVAVQIMNLKPEEYPLLVEAQRRNLVDKNFEIEIVGDSLESSIIPDYKNIRVQADSYANVIPKWAQKPFRNFFQRRPIIVPKKCKGCRKCFEHCPAKAISMEYDKNGCQYAKIDYKKCINCFCCQELCPFHVVTIKTPWGYKIIQRKKLKRNKKINKK